MKWWRRFRFEWHIWWCWFCDECPTAYCKKGLALFPPGEAKKEEG